MQTYKILTGDVLATLGTLPADFFDACLSDPPYGLSFMGKAWDHSVPSAAVYGELLRTMKPGAQGLHFGGTRTFHRLAVNIEDAGFAIRDTLMWLYGSGFPKSHNISKALDKAAGAEREVLAHKTRQPTRGQSAGASNGTGLGAQGGYNFKEHFTATAPATPSAIQWQGQGTALKPAWEPCLLVQKPLDGTFANNAIKHGCGGLNIDGSRVEFEAGINFEHKQRQQASAGSIEGAFGAAALIGKEIATYKEGGRFPANLILNEFAAEVLDASVPWSKSARTAMPLPDAPFTAKDGGTLAGTQTVRGHTDSGGPSRFFYCSKVGSKERNAGCEGLPEKQHYTESTATPNRDGREQQMRGNNHPTLKPLALTTYLSGLLLPPPRTDGQPRRILVPFSGSGSEMIGALLAGWDEVWGIEISDEYVEIAHARIKHHCPEVTP